MRERKRLRNVEALKVALGDGYEVHYHALSGEAVVRGGRHLVTFWPISCKWRSGDGVQLGLSIDSLVRYLKGSGE